MRLSYFESYWYLSIEDQRCLILFENKGSICEWFPIIEKKKQIQSIEILRSVEKCIRFSTWECNQTRGVTRPDETIHESTCFCEWLCANKWSHNLDYFVLILFQFNPSKQEKLISCFLGQTSFNKLFNPIQRFLINCIRSMCRI